MKFLSDINLRESIGIDFTTNTEESRRLYWDDFNRTLSLELGNGIIEQIGKELYIDVRNMGTSIIPNGTLIQGIGTVGESGRIIVQPTIADGTIAPETILGIATEDILVGEDGLATFFGAIHDIDTTGTSVGETWTMGDKLYANPNYSGGLTNVEPQAPNLKVTIGIVLYANALEGSILVNINYGSNFGSDHNVQFTNLLDGQLAMYNDTNKRWENINVSTLVLTASQSNVVDTGGYFSGTNVETVLQELGNERKFLYNLMSTGVTEFAGMTLVDTTHFNIGAAVGYIVDNQTDPDAPSVTRIEYSGGTNLTTPFLNTNENTLIFLDINGSIVFTTGQTPTETQYRDMIFLGRAIHSDKVSIAVVESTPIVLPSIASQLKDLWKSIGPINNGNYVYPADGNLTLSLNGGTLNALGLNYAVDRHQPTQLDIPSQTLLSFKYAHRNAIIQTTRTTLNPTSYDLNGVVTSIGGTWKQATNQRVFLTKIGTVVIQYGQQIYSSLSDAIIGLATERYVVNSALAANAILIGSISIEYNTTNLSDTTKVRFLGASKFGELSSGGGGGGSSANAIDIAITDTGNYFTGTDVETALQELGSAIEGISTTSSVVTEGSGIDVSSITEGSITTYTVSHEDTSTLSGDYGTAGIATITLDAMGHITAVSTANYLTTNSMDFAQVNVTDNDTGYNWQETGTITADQVGDTLTFVSDGGININVDPNADAIQIVNTDKGSSQNIFKNISVSGQPTLVADNNNDNLNLASGSNVTITTNAETDTITISSTDTIYTHPTGDGNLHVPATGTTNNGKVLTAGETAGSLSWQTPTGGGTDWSGTKAEYDAIVTKDPDTYYFITDELVGAQSISYSNTLTGLNAVHVQDAIDKTYAAIPITLPASGGNADTIDGYHVGNLAKSELPSLTNFNSFTYSGMFRIQSGYTNKPTGSSDWGQLIVANGSNVDTVTQIYGDYATGKLYTRSAYGIGGTPVWTTWKELMSTEGGTMAGILTAQSNAAYTTKQVRNIIVSTTDAVLASMGNGDIWIKI